MRVRVRVSVRVRARVRVRVAQRVAPIDDEHLLPLDQRTWLGSGIG